jgi:hypothetical protein
MFLHSRLCLVKQEISLNRFQLSTKLKSEEFRSGVCELGCSHGFPRRRCIPTRLFHYLTLSKVSGPHSERFNHSEHTSAMRNSEHQGDFLLSVTMEKLQCAGFAESDASSYPSRLMLWRQGKVLCQAHLSWSSIFMLAAYCGITVRSRSSIPSSESYSWSIYEQHEPVSAVNCCSCLS